MITLPALIWSAPIWALEAIILLIRAAQIKAGQIFRLIEILRHEWSMNFYYPIYSTKQSKDQVHIVLICEC